ncbi:NAD-dependent epimerase/dehydratase family protein [Phormidium sp. CLA17]|uniref:NAD-dependent epimerase/dehydratase family protein n=1 Tax=Leptolyngbya sp. Cla-17 TaxID=2803751 RepID=UPI001492B4F1|nr:NAD-dependent epimerase/dehydratase family protein [Leptolyngbya sp. Cla-17]MBM0741014.1 NAD-dependent epimerase/dehydratase family protein [Leptolyngbya sp. Cla-17]
MFQTGLIGYTGFVGSNLTRLTVFDACYNTQNIAEISGQAFETLVCAAPQAKKWWANQHPDEDCALVKQLINHLKHTQVERFILISSIDVFPTVVGVDETFDCASQSNHAYGRNRLMLEQFVAAHFPLAHIVRLPGLFGPGLRKNVIFDMINHNQPEKIDPDSRFQWYDVTRLWADLQTVVQKDLRLVMLATEPVATKEIQEQFFPTVEIGAEASGSAFYDVHTCHAKALGGSGKYLLTKEQVLQDIGRFVATEPRQAE